MPIREILCISEVILHFSFKHTKKHTQRQSNINNTLLLLLESFSSQHERQQARVCYFFGNSIAEQTCEV